MHEVVRYGGDRHLSAARQRSRQGWTCPESCAAAVLYSDALIRFLLDIGANQGKWSQGMLRAFLRPEKIVAIRSHRKIVADSQRATASREDDCPLCAKRSLGEEPFYVSGPRWFAASLYQRAETFCTQTEQQEIRVQ